MNIIILNENKIKKISYREKLENNTLWFKDNDIYSLSIHGDGYMPVDLDYVRRSNCYAEGGKFYFNPFVDFIFDDGTYERKYFPDTIESKSFLSELEKSLKFNIIKYQN